MSLNIKANFENINIRRTKMKKRLLAIIISLSIVLSFGTHLLAVENDFSLDIRSTEKPDYSVDVNSIFGPN